MTENVFYFSKFNKEVDMVDFVIIKSGLIFLHKNINEYKAKIHKKGTGAISAINSFASTLIRYKNKLQTYDRNLIQKCADNGIAMAISCIDDLKINDQKIINSFMALVDCLYSYLYDPEKFNYINKDEYSMTKSTYDLLMVLRSKLEISDSIVEIRLDSCYKQLVVIKLSI